MALPQLDSAYPIFIAHTRPPEHLAHVQGPGRLVSIGIATGKAAAPAEHRATALSQSDDAALVITILTLRRSQPDGIMTFYTTNTDIHEQLVHARLAEPGVRTRRRSFYELQHFLELAEAVDSGKVRIIVLDDATRDDERFRRAYDLAHGRALADAKSQTRLTPLPEWGDKPCVLLSFNGVLLWKCNGR